jgi:cytochrome P450
MYWLHSPREFYRQCKQVHAFADYYVNLALTTDLTKSSTTPTGRQKYIFLAELVKSTRDPLELRSQLLNILLAGRDTTAGLLGWTFYVLARHPAAYAKLRKIVLDAFGTYEHPRDITFTNLKACSHLQHVLSEILRLYATVPMNSRRATKDTTLPRGGGPDGLSPVYIKRDQEVNYAVHVMHRRTDIWGADANEFRPERWEGRKLGWEFLPFNGGPRICLGQQFALTEAGFVIVRLLQRFGGVENMDAEETVRHQYSLTTSPKRCAVRLRVGES